MDVPIKHLEEIWTADGKKLGVAKYLHYRLEGVDPELELYATYLEVEDFEYGTEYFVPTDFLAGRNTNQERVSLTTSLQQVLENTWTRRPDFLLHKAGRTEPLPRQ
jgi:hypothetical protein